METYTNIRLPVIILHRKRLYRLSQTAAGGLVLKAVEGEETSDLDRERGNCVILTANSSTTATPGGA